MQDKLKKVLSSSSLYSDSDTVIDANFEEKLTIKMIIYQDEISR